MVTYAGRVRWRKRGENKERHVGYGTKTNEGIERLNVCMIDVVRLEGAFWLSVQE